MQANTQTASVVAFYDAHPINEDQILHTLAAKASPESGSPRRSCKDYDQDHFGGVEANDILAAKAGIAKQHRVLDVCSGMGGPARYLADRIGCRGGRARFHAQPLSRRPAPDRAWCIWTTW